MIRNRVLAAVFVAALAAPAASGKEALQPRDVKVFNLWSKAVKEEYTLYRSLEDELLLHPKKVGAKDERAGLARNLHQDLEPDPDIATRLIEAGKPFYEVDQCRIAIRRFRAIMSTAQRVNSINEKPYPQDAKGYLDAATACERGMKLPRFDSRFREIARTVL